MMFVEVVEVTHVFVLDRCGGMPLSPPPPRCKSYLHLSGRLLVSGGNQCQFDEFTVGDPVSLEADATLNGGPGFSRRVNSAIRAIVDPKSATLIVVPLGDHLWESLIVGVRPEAFDAGDLAWDSATGVTLHPGLVRDVYGPSAPIDRLKAIERAINARALIRGQSGEAFETIVGPMVEDAVVLTAAEAERLGVPPGPRPCCSFLFWGSKVPGGHLKDRLWVCTGPGSFCRPLPDQVDLEAYLARPTEAGAPPKARDKKGAA